MGRWYVTKMLATIVLWNIGTMVCYKKSTLREYYIYITLIIKNKKYIIQFICDIFHTLYIKYETKKCLYYNHYYNIEITYIINFCIHISVLCVII